jgi:hypothetical protein
MSISKSEFLPAYYNWQVVRLAAKLRRSSMAAVVHGKGCGLGAGPAAVGPWVVRGIQREINRLGRFRGLIVTMHCLHLTTKQREIPGFIS